MYYAEDCYGQADSTVVPADPVGWAGHGTHVAGTAGGATYGVAPAARKLISVRVIECDNWMTLSDLIDGVEWITQNADPNVPAVANLSLGGPATADTLVEASEDAIRASIQATGIVYVVAAGNNGGAACDFSPARMEEVITVAASDSTDVRWSGSNFGSCVDVFAPGESIVSAAASVGQSASCTSCSRSATGTSMATPHVSGVDAQILQRYGALAPAAARDTVLAWATAGQLTGIGSGSPNLLAFTHAILSSAIAGTDTAHDTLTYEWDAVPAGGNFNFTYEWSRRYYWDGVPDAWSVIGYGATVEPSIFSGSPPFELRLKVWSGWQDHTSYKYVHVICTEPCVELPRRRTRIQETGEMR